MLNEAVIDEATNAERDHLGWYREGTNAWRGFQNARKDDNVGRGRLGLGHETVNALESLSVP